MMDTYRRKINLRHFRMHGKTGGDIAVNDGISFLPSREAVDMSGNSVNAVSLETYVHYKRWIERFMVESSIFEVRKRMSSFTLVDAREYDSEYINSGTSFDGQKRIIAGWFCNDCCGVYPDEDSALSSIDDGCCGKKVFINVNSDEFHEMFGTIENACALMEDESEGTVPQEICLPIYISDTIQDLGMYDVYDDGSPASAVCRYDIADGDDVYLESRLNTLFRAKKSFDEDGGILPYYRNESASPARNELPYAFNIPCDVVYSDGAFVYNILTEINYYTENGVPVSEAKNATYYDGSMMDNGVIEFVYTVGAVDGLPDSGIEYTEKRKYSVSGNTIFVEEKTEDNPEDYDTGKLYAKVRIGDACDYEYAMCLIKNDAFISIQDAKLDVRNVHIDRGTSAAYEAFNVLGETNTIEDIENYRDDWFRIKGKND